MTKLKSLLPIIFLASTMGCASKTTTWTDEPYKMGEGLPHATLVSNIQGRLSEGEMAKVTTPLDSCDDIKIKSDLRTGLLFKYDKDSSPAELVQKVPANKPFYIQYQEFGPGSSCFVHVVVKLEPGKTYTLIGGGRLVKGKIPILTDKQGCAVGVIDNETGRPVSYDHRVCSG